MKYFSYRYPIFYIAVTLMTMLNLSYDVAQLCLNITCFDSWFTFYSIICHLFLQNKCQRKLESAWIIVSCLQWQFSVGKCYKSVFSPVNLILLHTMYGYLHLLSQYAQKRREMFCSIQMNTIRQTIISLTDYILNVYPVSYTHLTLPTSDLV